MKNLFVSKINLILFAVFSYFLLFYFIRVVWQFWFGSGGLESEVMSQERTLTLNDDTSATVNLFGATITSWMCCGNELLFVSKKSKFDVLPLYHGGIPIVFPHFGAWSSGPQHGFARSCMWRVEEEPHKLEDGSVVAVFSLSDNEKTRQMWDHGFKLSYKVTLSKCKLSTELSVTNTGSSPFDFTCLLHNYFNIPDMSKCQIVGLKGSSYKDKVRNFAEFVEEGDFVTINANIDNIYANTKDELLLKGASDGWSIKVTKSNLPDTVVWNPWSDNAKKMSDFGDEEYLNMVCIEPGSVSKPTSLAAGKVFSASQTLLPLKQ